MRMEALLDHYPDYASLTSTAYYDKAFMEVRRVNRTYFGAMVTKVE